ncbi:hypothetical protein A2276_03150 [candidate division WOR-1 bacterium RIFOXYA12_FULL_43_27]|uniref:Glycosyltransferase 2-like domain-containing protein n=1 Tax=candidate division WOR-1 bacterium RIFOXYC2_FULL_46_14 TaxID=1802587 RepID=A0A1F4U7T5_UNCSA|nr:MAG: hypothetical protein A2276_03150 [candidate division WOR-1 bacterium RIFOXYA12_FULL_43_27]OGC19300.1 MAG: hypothetical protein A2292_01185 [candidate division WOR-1 bacterium RIFOXYB2_FULL_46_45]OGC30289.1 MAG: hypothetical protein A2232_01185 [candidate division WOR-1 bacterium RIFOXYA2_FULL_46_56]OGC40890.1 MAG: hypothetical protein A2438_01185 [candidate division WOR-1 bacterium RIFOXYC2_FULL_46_14]
MRKELSISIPFLDEEQGISILHSRISPVIKQLEENYEVELILIDDGSTDSTFDLLKQFFSQAKIIRHPKNLGIGAAMRSGFDAFSGDYIVFLDSDCTFAPEEICAMLEIISKDDKIDVVSASPYHPKGGVEGVPVWRLVFSKGASWLYRRLVSDRIYTYTSFMRIYKREAANKLKFENNGFIAVTEVMVRSIYLGLNIVEYPAVLSVRKYGRSKIKVFKVVMEHLRFILSLPKIKKDPCPKP